MPLIGGLSFFLRRFLSLNPAPRIVRQRMEGSAPVGRVIFVRGGACVDLGLNTHVE